MKKLLALLCALFIADSAFSSCLVYRWIFVGPKYEKQSVGNSSTRQVYNGYLVLIFDPNTKEYLEQQLVMYWVNNGKRYRNTIVYPAAFSVNTVVPNSNGFTFMKSFSQPDWSNISFEFTSARKQITFNTTPDLDQKNPITIDGLLRGHRILDKSDSLGNFTLNYGKISAKLDYTMTRQNLNAATADTVTSGIELMLDQSGYNQWTE